MQAVFFLVKMATAVVAAALCVLSIVQIFVNAADHMPIGQIAITQWLFLIPAFAFALVAYVIPFTLDDVIPSNW